MPVLLDHLKVQLLRLSQALRQLSGYMAARGHIFGVLYDYFSIIIVRSPRPGTLQLTYPIKHDHMVAALMWVTVQSLLPANIVQPYDSNTDDRFYVDYEAQLASAQRQRNPLKHHRPAPDHLAAERAELPRLFHAMGFEAYRRGGV